MLFSIITLAASLVSTAHAEPVPGKANEWRTGIFADAKWTNEDMVSGDTYQVVAREAKEAYDKAIAAGNKAHIDVWGSCDIHMPQAPEYNTAYCAYRSDGLADALRDLGLDRMVQIANDEWADEHDRRAYARLVIDEPPAAYNPPPTVCQLVAGPSMYWDGLQAGEEGIRTTTVTWACNGPNPPSDTLEVNLRVGGEHFDMLTPSPLTLWPNVPEEVLVRFTAPDTSPHRVSLEASADGDTVTVEGQAQARPVPTSAAGFTPCEWGFGAHLGANASLQGLAGIGAGDIYVPVRTKKGRCDAFRLSAGWGITPDRDGETPLDQWQALGSVTSAYQLAGGYEWGWDDHLKRLEVGGQIVAVRVHPDASSDLYQAGPRVAWSPRFGVVQLQVWGSPGLMWGYADESATWSAAFGQPATGSAWRFQPTLSGGLDMGLRF